MNPQRRKMRVRLLIQTGIGNNSRYDTHLTRLLATACSAWDPAYTLKSCSNRFPNHYHSTYHTCRRKPATILGTRSIQGHLWARWQPYITRALRMVIQSFIIRLDMRTCPVGMSYGKWEKVNDSFNEKRWKSRRLYSCVCVSIELTQFQKQQVTSKQ